MIFIMFWMIGSEIVSMIISLFMWIANVRNNVLEMISKAKYDAHIEDGRYLRWDESYEKTHKWKWVKCFIHGNPID